MYEYGRWFNIKIFYPHNNSWESTNEVVSSAIVNIVVIVNNIEDYCKII